MADLKTNYVDDVLDSSKNQLRKYQQIQNDDGTVSFVDVTEYSTTGTSFGAKDINDTNAAVNELNKSLGSINSNLVEVRTDVSQNSADIQTIASAQIPESTVSNAVTNYVNSHSGEFATKTDVSELKSDLGDLMGNDYFSNLSSDNSCFEYKPNTVANPNGLNADNDYDTYLLTAEKTFSLYFDNATLSANYYISLCDFNGIPSSSTFVVRKRKSENNMPLVDSKYSVLKGHTIAITLPKTNSFYIFANYNNGSKLVFKNKIYKDFIVDYRNESSTLQTFTILSKCDFDDVTYLGQRFCHYTIPNSSVDSNRNTDMWQLDTLSIYTLTNGEFVKGNDIVLIGEWEGAFQEVGASDFMGGRAHGDDRITDFYALIDGKVVDLTTDFTIQANTINFVVRSKMNRVGEPTTYLFDHTKNYLIDKSGIRYDQTFKPLQNLTMDMSYVTMFPVSRDFTTKVIRSSDTTIQDISQDGHAVPYYRNAKETLCMFSDNFSANIEVECSDTYNPLQFISGSSNPRYNKYYFSFCESGTTIDANVPIIVSTKISYRLGGLSN